jgi:hypothetical protein
MKMPDVPKLACAMIISAAYLWSGPTALSQPAAYCDAQARDFANSYNSSGPDIVGGALAGALGGAALGGVLGGKRKSVGRGALIGAGAGTAAGVANTSGRWQQDYNYAYQRCMVATDRTRAPPAGTQAWLDYCSAKYRSFDPASGLYLSYSGNYKPCR